MTTATHSTLFYDGPRQYADEVGGVLRDALLRGHRGLVMAPARRVDELRQVFLQAVSHELRTPLTAILGFGATLRDHLGLARPASRYAAARGADRSATTQGEPA